jgi:hypothetical protein
MEYAGRVGENDLKTPFGLSFLSFLLQDPTALALGLDVNGSSEETSTVSLDLSTPLRKKCLDMVFEKGESF